MQFRNFFFHQSHKNMEYNIDLVHVETIEIENHIFSIHNICENNECF